MSSDASAFREFEAQSLFCARCRRAVAVRKKLLLVLPTGNQYDYICQECGTAVGGKVDRDATAFHETTRAAAAARPRPPGAPSPPRPRRRG
jgi:DNA-directed RNA polymerase subunit RPC12/RpoP